MKSDKPYIPRQPYRSDSQRRPRKPVHNSRLPGWIAKHPVVLKFSRLSRKRKVILVGWTGLSTLVVIGLFTTVYFANSLGSKQRIMNRNDTGVTLLDQSGTPFYRLYNARTDTYVPLSAISQIAQKAAIASEDKNFYKEPGFSPAGIVNALWQNIKPGGLKNGGSTITQQLVKNSLLTQNRSIVRKYQELVLSVEIERRYSKDEILEMYLNSVYFGEGSFGIEDAAQTYFGVPAKDLDTAQSTMLIGLLPAPSAYSPISGSAIKAKSRQTYVLGRMEKDGSITGQQEEAAIAEPLSYVPKKAVEDLKAPDFALMVRDELVKKYGEENVARSGYRVTTSLNMDWQTAAQQDVQLQINRLSRSSVSNGSAVVINPKTGEIQALVGSVDYNNPQFGKVNMAITTRQPGSSFKPFVYSEGIEEGKFSAASLWNDHLTDFGGGYEPKNYDLRYHGEVTTRRALANSFNIPAVAALQKVGINSVIDNATKLGLTTLDKKNDYGLPFALGTAQARLTEMTSAYGVFANNGERNIPTTITSITDKNNHQIFKHTPQNKQVISAQTSYIMSSMLSDNTARAETFGSSLTLTNKRPAAVKTGTTENYKDAWTIGYTPNAVVGVWIGNNDNTPMNSVAGSLGAAPIWKNILQYVSSNKPVEQFTQPGGLTIRSICRADGALADTSGSNTMTEYFIPGTLPTTHCNSYQPQLQPTQTTTPPKSTNQNEVNTTDPIPPSSGSGDGGDATNTGNGNGTGTPLPGGTGTQSPQPGGTPTTPPVSP